MTRPKKGGGGRHTPKSNTAPNDVFGDADILQPSDVPNFPHMDPDAFEQAILESSIDITGLDPENLDLEALGLGDVDPLEILVARMAQALDEGAGQFLEEVAGASWMLHETVPEDERPAALELYASFDHIGACLMVGLASLGMTPEVRDLASAKVTENEAAGIEVPAWLSRLADASVTATGIGFYEPDDEVEVLVEVTIPTVNPFVVAISRSKVVHELITEISTLIEPLQHLADDVNGDELMEVTIAMTDAVDAADELALSLLPTIEWAENIEVGGLPVDNGVETVLPLARWVGSLLPASEVEPFYGFEGEQRDEAIAAYVAASPDQLDADHLAQVAFALDFSVEREVFRWTPQRLINMFQRATMVTDEPQPLIDAVRKFLPFAAAQHGTSDELLAHNLTVVDNVEEHASELFSGA